MLVLSYAGLQFCRSHLCLLGIILALDVLVHVLEEQVIHGLTNKQVPKSYILHAREIVHQEIFEAGMCVSVQGLSLSRQCGAACLRG